MILRIDEKKQLGWQYLKEYLLILFEKQNDPYIVALIISSYVRIGFVDGSFHFPKQFRNALRNSILSNDDLISNEAIQLMVDGLYNGSRWKDEVVVEDIVIALLSHASRCNTKRLIQILTLFAHLFNGRKGFESLEGFIVTIPLIYRCLNDKDLETVTSAAFTLKTFSDEFDYEEIQSILDQYPQLPDLLSKLLLSTREDLVLSVLEIIRNFTSGHVHQIQTLIEADIVSRLPWLLDHPNKKIVEISCSIICRICFSVIDHIQLIIDTAIIPKILKILSSDDYSYEIKEITANIFVAILKGESLLSQQEYLVNEGLGDVVCVELMKVPSDIEYLEYFRPLHKIIMHLIPLCEKSKSRQKRLFKAIVERQVLAKVESFIEIAATCMDEWFHSEKIENFITNSQNI